MNNQNQVVIEMKNISKTFGEVIANTQINFDVKKGEIHALLGENGAGKSTLMNMLSGIYLPDGGSIYVHGVAEHIGSPKVAIKKGIGMIHQHYKLVEVLTGLENIVMGLNHAFFLDYKKMEKQVRQIADKYGLVVNLNKKVYDMSISEKQTLEIIKVLYRGADILILDEPTAVLTPQETKKLFQIIRNMTREGCGVIIITHKLHEVMEISDRVTVLRKGTTVATVKTKETTPKELTDLMVGKSVDLAIERVMTEKQPDLLKVNSLSAVDRDQVKVLDNINFELSGGEILGVAGVAGSGQKELCEVLVGLFPVTEGTILFENENIIGKKPKEIIEKGISMSFVPEDRLGMGLVASMDMIDNYLIKAYHHQKGWKVDRKSIKLKCENLINQLEIKTPGVYHPIKQLSGGNIQKVLLGREIESNPHVLITAYPVRGLDIGASHRIYDLINEQKQKGVGVLFIGEDLDVLMELCDRILVLCDGKITGIVKAENATKEMLGLMMAGETLLEEEVNHEN